METYTIVQKAFKIDIDQLEEGYLSAGHECHAEDVNKAKTILFNQIKYDDWKHKFTLKEITYLNIPVVRAKHLDKVLFEDKEVIRYTIPEILKERERAAELERILNDPGIKYCYIIKGSYYRPNASGYTSMQYMAGVYTKEEAVSSAKSCKDIRLSVINIEAHNKMINDVIAELSSRIIEI